MRKKPLAKAIAQMHPPLEGNALMTASTSNSEELTKHSKLEAAVDSVFKEATK